MTSDYLSAALMILCGVGFALLLTAAAKYLGPHRPSAAKDYPYECGSEVIGSPRARFEVKFYQVAIVFLVFDIETAFLYPWALKYRDALLRRRRRRREVRGRRLLLRPRRDRRLHGDPDRRAGLRLAQARHRVGVAMGALDWVTTKLTDATNWARKFSLFQYPFVTACCGMEFMSVAAPKYDIARFGAEFPRFSPRQADLLIIVGTITERQGPALRRIYDQMCEPKWVVAFGVCASTGGFYQNYSTMPGADQVVPVDVYIPGCPPRPEQVLDGLILLQERIQRGEGHSQIAIAAEAPRRAQAGITTSRSPAIRRDRASKAETP